MQAIARWGNFFNQELYGPPTTLPWGIPIECAHRDRGLRLRRRAPLRRRPRPLPPAVPVRIALRASLGALVLIWLGFHFRKRLRPGDLLLIFFIWYGVVRFVLETLRDGQLDVLRRPDRPDRVGRCSSSRRCVILVWRHRPGHPLDEPATARGATWGAIGRPLTRTSRSDSIAGATTRTTTTMTTTTTTRTTATTTKDGDDDDDDGDERRRRRGDEADDASP